MTKNIATKNLGELHGPSAFATGRQFCVLLPLAPPLYLELKRGKIYARVTRGSNKRFLI